MSAITYFIIALFALSFMAGLTFIPLFLGGMLSTMLPRRGLIAELLLKIALSPYKAIRFVQTDTNRYRMSEIEDYEPGSIPVTRFAGCDMAFDLDRSERLFGSAVERVDADVIDASDPTTIKTPNDVWEPTGVEMVNGGAKLRGARSKKTVEENDIIINRPQFLASTGKTAESLYIEARRAAYEEEAGDSSQSEHRLAYMLGMIGFGLVLGVIHLFIIA